MNQLRPFFYAASALAIFAPAQALAADADACGNIELVAVGECHFEFSGGCKASCEPVSFVAACDGACNADLDASCTASCATDCRAATVARRSTPSDRPLRLVRAVPATGNSRMRSVAARHAGRSCAPGRIR